MAQPLISYPGAKWRFYPEIKQYLPRDMKLFVEPFFGGGSMSLSVADDPEFSSVERIVGGDLAPEIWALWEGCKKCPHDMISVIENWRSSKMPHKVEIEKYGTLSAIKSLLAEVDKYTSNSEELTQELKDFKALYDITLKECKEFWEWSQKVDCSTLTLAERAARTYVVNMISFSGMGDSGSMSNEQVFKFRGDRIPKILETSKILSKIEIYNIPFEETFAIAKQNSIDTTFVFLDPPYYRQEGSGLYGKNGDTHHGFPHDKFAEETKKLKCKWFVTYDDSIKVRRMFQGKTEDNKSIIIKPFTIGGGYVLAQRGAEDALAGEEVFIANYDIADTNADDILGMI